MYHKLVASKKETFIDIIIKTGSVASLIEYRQNIYDELDITPNPSKQFIQTMISFISQLTIAINKQLLGPIIPKHIPIILASGRPNSYFIEQGISLANLSIVSLGKPLVMKSAINTITSFFPNKPFSLYCLEDDAIVKLTYQSFFEDFDVPVVFFNNPEEFLEYLTSIPLEPFSIIMSDNDMQTPIKGINLIMDIRSGVFDKYDEAKFDAYKLAIANKLTRLK